MSGEDHRLRQESTISVDGEPLTIVSEVLLEPEALTVTRVLRGDEELRKRVAPIPAASVAEYAEHGADALYPCLHKAHLGVLQNVLSAPKTPQQAFRAPPGVFAAAMLEGAKMTPVAGAQNIPGSWERAAYVLSALTVEAQEELGLGRVEEATLISANIAARIRCGAEQSAVVFLDPSEIDVDTAEVGATLAQLLGEAP